MSLRTDVLMRAGVLLVLPLLVTAAATTAGCGRTPASAERLTPRADAAVRMTAQPVATFPGRRVSALLDFDSPDDLTFIATDPAGVAANDTRIARSGRRSLLLPRGTRDVTIKLPSLLSGRSFPADWTLLGAFFHCDRQTVVTMSYEVGGTAALSRSVSVAAGAWTPVMIDLAALSASADAEVGVLRIAFDSRDRKSVV